MLNEYSASFKPGKGDGDYGKSEGVQWLLFERPGIKRAFCNMYKDSKYFVELMGYDGRAIWGGHPRRCGALQGLGIRSRGRRRPKRKVGVLGRRGGVAERATGPTMKVRRSLKLNAPAHRAPVHQRQRALEGQKSAAVGAQSSINRFQTAGDIHVRWGGGGVDVRNRLRVDEQEGFGTGHIL